MKRHRTRHRGVYYRLDSKNRRRYVIWYEDSTGKGIYKTLPLGTTEQDAVKERAKVVDKLARGERVVNTRLTLEEYGRQWLHGLSGLSEASQQTYRKSLENHVFPLYGRRKLGDLRIDDVAALVRRMQQDGKKGWTIASVLTPLSRMYARAIREGLVNVNPVKGLDKSEKPRPYKDQQEIRILERDEIQLLLNVASKKYKPLFQTAIFTGLRLGELRRLRWGDVDFAGGVIHVRQSKTQAGERDVVMAPSLARVLATHSLEQKPTSSFVFSDPTGGELSEQTVRDALHDTLQRAGLPRNLLRVHDLRHTFASLLISNPSNDIAFVSKQLGHANISTTLDTYSKLWDARSKAQRLREQMEVDFAPFFVE